MNLHLFLREVVGIAVQFERGASADGERVIEKRLKRDDELLPSERTTGAPVNAPCRLVEPARTYIMAEELSRIAMLLEPRRVDENPFG
jgi:hypothetical protein